MKVTKEIIDATHAKIFANIEHATTKLEVLQYDFEHDQMGKLDKEQYQILINKAKKQLSIWNYMAKVTELNNRYGNF